MDNDTTIKITSEEFLSVDYSKKHSHTSDKSSSNMEGLYGRYRDFRHLASGGEGMIHICLDPTLDRYVAIKTLHLKLQKNAISKSRFTREARIMSQLEHPSIIPVHELGKGADGRLYFTMKYVRGKTLKEILKLIKNKNKKYSKAYPREKLIDIFLKVCQAIEFAHSKKVRHRDLKPENIIIGDFGEVQIMDWGLLRILGNKEEPSPDDTNTVYDSTNIMTTLAGEVSGTPTYMSPEQALGEQETLDERADIYSLGAILYNILTLENYVTGDNVKQTLKNILIQETIPPRKRAPSLKISRELNAICMKCLEKSKDNRYKHVSELVKDLHNYKYKQPVSAYKPSILNRFVKLCLRHPVYSASILTTTIALSLMGSYRFISSNINYNTIMNTANEYREIGDKYYNKAYSLQKELNKLQKKNILKTISDKEEELIDKINLARNQFNNNYDTASLLYARIATKYDPVRIHSNLQIYKNKFQFAVLTKDFNSQERYFSILTNWQKKNDPLNKNIEIKNFIKYIQKSLYPNGTVSISCNESYTNVELYSLEKSTFEKKIVLKHLNIHPKTPTTMDLHYGSYLLSVKKDGRIFNFPFMVERAKQTKVMLCTPKDIPQDTTFIPGGYFIAGGKNSKIYRTHKVFLPPYLIKSTEVTFGEYIKFWLSLTNDKDRKKYMSRIRLNRERRFIDAWDNNGVLIKDFSYNMPVVGITKEAAAEYCHWLSKMNNIKYRLPTSYEWEKAARGVDGREYIWGDRFIQGLSLVDNQSKKSKEFKYFAPVKYYKNDISIYGVFDMAGNAREWTSTKFPNQDRFFEIKGASASTTARFAACAYASDTPVVPTDVGFRYVIEI